jgi:hypothetical protein
LTYAKGLAREFSASRKHKTRDAWFSESAYFLLESEWVGLLRATDAAVEPDDDVYFAGLLGGMIGELPSDVIRPLQIRFFLDESLPPESETRGHHTLNALEMILPQLPPLEGLSIDNFRLKDLDTIGSFTALKALSIAGCKNVSDFSPLTKLNSLELLRLDDTGIADLSPLIRLPNLRVLSLEGCCSAIDGSMKLLAEAYTSGALPNLARIKLRRAGSGISDATLHEDSAGAVLGHFI